ncbi:hypothetical protein [Tortoise microvirus 16]|nr:hypothetical protein [Tortoise microvirus 16]QCS37050.1 hypothetical protein [Tortoise microvirus 45]
MMFSMRSIAPSTRFVGALRDTRSMIVGSFDCLHFTAKTLSRILFAPRSWRCIMLIAQTVLFYQVAMLVVLISPFYFLKRFFRRLTIY